MTATRLALLVAAAGAACTRPGESRALAELEVGQGALADAEVGVAGGLAAISELGDHRLALWAQAPVLDIEIVLRTTAAGAWSIEIANALPDAELVVDGTPVPRIPGARPTVAAFVADLAPGPHALRLAPPDADVIEPFRVAAMADIQTALPEVDDLFRAISVVPDARFVVAMGDLTERGEAEEYALFDEQLGALAIPFYTTLGNHELWGPPDRWLTRFGRASFQFQFKGVAFTFADSGDAGLDPVVEGWLDGWLAEAQALPHVFLTHMPPVDPVGVRYGSFRSTRDGHRLLARLADGGVDLTLYGHIHTYEAFENAGIRAYISGGGGAQPMRWDGVGRHFLLVGLDPAAPGGIGRVERREL